MSHYTLDTHMLTENMNNANREFLYQMLREGVINEDQFSASQEYAITLVKKSALGAIWDKLWGKEDKATKIIIVKVLKEQPDNADVSTDD